MTCPPCCRCPLCWPWASEEPDCEERLAWLEDRIERGDRTERWS